MVNGPSAAPSENGLQGLKGCRGYLAVEQFAVYWHLYLQAVYHVYVYVFLCFAYHAMHSKCQRKR